MKRVEGLVALVTGAAGGMGSEHVRLLIAEGARVGIADIDSQAGAALARELGDNAAFVHLDVTQPDSWTAAVDTVTAAFGPITILINNAGVSGPAVQVAELDPATYERLIAINQHSIFFGMRAVIPGMIAAGGGSIVNVASIAGFVHEAIFPNAAYTAAKFAVRGLTRAAAVEYGKNNIRVNALCPGGVLTPMLLESHTAEELQRSAQGLPLRRFASPQEISSLMLFLASDESSFVTGAEYVIDGGQIID